MAWVDAGPAEPVRDGEVRAFRAGDRHLAVALVQGEWLGFADACTHHECPLADGILDGATIECDCHGSIFELRTGAVVRGPATEPLPVYATQTLDGRIRVQLGDQGATP